VLRDPLAIPVLGIPAATLREDASAHPERGSMRWFICARSRFAEDCVADTVRHGPSQLVILGAGLDTFGYRHGWPGLRVVEIDHPDTQRWKLDRLLAAGIDPSPVRHYSLDFERDDLSGALGRVVDADSPVLVWWLGVTPYLTREAIRATLAALATMASTGAQSAPAGVAVVLDHASPISGTRPEHQAAMRRPRARAAAVGEPWLSEFEPGDMTGELRRAGFDQVLPIDERAVIRRALDGAVTTEAIRSSTVGGAPAGGEPTGGTAVAVPRPTHLMLATRHWNTHGLAR